MGNAQTNLSQEKLNNLSKDTDCKIIKSYN